MITRWHLHLARRAVMARIPFVDTLREIKRRATGYHPDESNIGSTFFDLRRLNALMRVNGVQFRGTILEIGSGWFPIAGIIARLAGASRVLLTDHIRYMDQGTFSAAKEIVLRHASELGATFDFEPDAGRTKLLKASTPQEFNMTYLAPFDLKVVPNGSLDLVISRACLEHIPVSDLEFLMAGLRPKLKKGGFMAHAIDNSDHFSHIDPSISRVNFLTWSEAKHRLIYQIGKGGENRLRHHEYAALFRRTGYVVVDDDALIHDETLQTLSVMNLSAPYDSMAAEQLAAISSWYILRPE